MDKKNNKQMKSQNLTKEIKLDMANKRLVKEDPGTFYKLMELNGMDFMNWLIDMTLNFDNDGVAYHLQYSLYY